VPPWAGSAQAVRAILLASATATTLKGRRARGCVSQGYFPGFSRARRNTAIAPTMRMRLRYWSPCRRHDRSRPDDADARKPLRQGDRGEAVFWPDQAIKRPVWPYSNMEIEEETWRGCRMTRNEGPQEMTAVTGRSGYRPPQSSTRPTIRQRNFLFSMRVNALTRANPSEVARNSFT
jgi:hypothetical protein